ncbi:MAG: siderophore-interacting protein [Actinomycetota bacterium]|nr:siderophore-interacting protein [Actinomycetota bacterium]MDQ2956869.1 siderophore-interacting protein [Actinomycetota bacterium]
MTTPAPNRRAPRPQAVLAVQRSEWLSPHLIRITAGGEGFAAFQTNDYTDKYVKIVFADPALGLVPPYDLAALRESLPPDQRPVTRTYTVRRVDVARHTLDIDFVVHGSEGVAGPWAANAQPGDLLTLSGAGGGYTPDPSDDWHLFLGDESALPAIGSALEALADDARGIAYLEAQEAIDLTAPAGVELVWLDRGEPGTEPQLLADALAKGRWLDGRVGVFAHGERESVKAIRAALKNRDLGGGQLSLSGYWAYGRTEDRFQAEKREPIGQLGA